LQDFTDFIATRKAHNIAKNLTTEKELLPLIAAGAGVFFCYFSLPLGQRKVERANVWQQNIMCLAAYAVGLGL